MLRCNLLKLIHAANITPSSASSLTGKRIKHKFQESNGKFKNYKGHIISQVPGFPEWFNIVYDNEPNIVYTYNLTEDIANKDLQVL